MLSVDAIESRYLWIDADGRLQLTPAQRVHEDRRPMTDPQPMTVAELERALEALELTQTGLARALGVAPRSVRFWLASRSPVPAPCAALVRLLVSGKIAAADLEAAHGERPQ